MRKPWAGLGLDLHLELSAGPGVRAGLEDALREAVRSGRLPPGTRLPSSRALAADLGLARGTVSQTYEQLVAEGYLTSRPGSGTCVAVLPGPVPEPARAEPVTRPPRRAGSESLETIGFDLRPGLPDLSSFPRAGWLAATRRVLGSAPNAAFGYGPWQGHLELRETLAEYLGRARGVVTTPERVVVCAGFGQALAQVGMVLHHEDARVVGVEEPFLPEYVRDLRRAGFGVRPIPVDDEGLRVAELAATPADAMLVTPAHQYPLGVTLSPRRRADLVAWADRTGGLIIEDDYDGEFRYDRQPVGALQGLHPDRIIYGGTTSKSLAPGLRLAWLALPARHADALRALGADADPAVSVIDQLVLADLIRSGELDRHLRRARLRYRRRRDRVATALAADLPDLRLSGIAAGLQTVILLPEDGPSEAEVVASVNGRGVAIDGVSGYYASPGRSPRGLVLGYATPAEHGFEPALRALVTALIPLYR
jgi:GntR family transcriptional regulator / MocR family aminotransferase